MVDSLIIKKFFCVLITQDNIYILCYIMAVVRAEQFHANGLFSYLFQFIKKKNLKYPKYICYSKLVSKYYLQLVVNNQTEFFFFPVCGITRSILQIKPEAQKGI